MVANNRVPDSRRTEFVIDLYAVFWDCLIYVSYGDMKDAEPAAVFNELKQVTEGGVVLTHVRCHGEMKTAALSCY